ncbi:hypothetical protein D1007_27679 [Hordeum vulgare]|nr:hypothetical protein D1007_27679 [Hordeum vulgare]
MVTALAKLDIKLDLLSGCIDDVNLAIDVDIDELRGEIGADRSTHVAPSSAPVSPKEPARTLNYPPSIAERVGVTKLQVFNFFSSDSSC